MFDKSVRILICFNVLLFVSGDFTKLLNDEFSDVMLNEEYCENILSDFASYAANLTLCSMKNARPITLCENCMDQYILFFNKSEEFFNIKVNGTSCKSIYTSKDRLNVVMEYYNSIVDIWDKGNCNACYDWTNGRPQLSNSTKHFKRLYHDTMDCINSNKPIPTSICDKCEQYYDDLNKYYKKLSPDSVGIDCVCMDVVDLMNTTRSLWSKTLNCCQRRRSPEIVFLCSTAIISVLPLLYYLVLRYCGPIRDLPNVLKQSRFKQTLLGSFHGRIN